MRNEEVVFVYLALNDKEKAWRDMSRKHQIEENNYLILNSRSSEFISQTNLDAIPRYMIYDKKRSINSSGCAWPGPKRSLRNFNHVFEKIKIACPQLFRSYRAWFSLIDLFYKDVAPVELRFIRLSFAPRELGYRMENHLF